MDKHSIPDVCDSEQGRQIIGAYYYNPDIVQILEDPRLLEDKNVNCVSFVFFMEGLIDRELFIDPAKITEDYLRVLFDEAPEAQADIIAIISDDKILPNPNDVPHLCHIALVDPNNNNYIIQRTGTGHPIIRMEKMFMAGIEEGFVTRPLFLRRKGHHNQAVG